MKEETRTAVKHEYEHAAPTVMHDPEQDMTVLARWLHRGMKQGPKFWFLAGGVVVVVVLISTLVSGLSAGRSTASKAWGELDAAQTPGQKKEVAEAHPGTQVARIARLQAASEYFFTATRDLPANREAAGPQLQSALEQFREVAKEAPKDSSEALAAAFGIARTLEARNELPEAIEAYQAVASGWPGTEKAKEAQALADRLKDPEVVAFYKELYTYKPPAAALPPGLNGLPADHPPLGGPTVPGGPLSTSDLLKSLTSPPVGSTLPMPTTSPSSAIPGPAPIDLEPPPLLVPPSAKPEAAPAKAAEPAKSGDLPKDVFTPPAQPKS
jgi:hypothetical protein